MKENEFKDNPFAIDAINLYTLPIKDGGSGMNREEAERHVKKLIEKNPKIFKTNS